MKAKTTSTSTTKPAHTVAPVDQRTSPAASTAMPTAPVGAKTPVADAAQEKWANKINQQLRQGLEAFIAVGNELIAAKKALGHGGFGAMLNSGLVKIDQRTAEMLMRVAGHPALSNPNNCSILPLSLHSLNKLAALDVPVIEQAIKAGEITPTMTIADAGDLVRSKRDAQSNKATEPAAAVPAGAPEPESPTVADEKTATSAAAFDVQAFKAALMEFLDNAYAKITQASAAEMQEAAAAACSEFFSVRIATTSNGVKPVASGLRGSNNAAQQRCDIQEGVDGVVPSAASESASPAGLALPVFRKKYPLPDADQAQLQKDLTALRTSEPTSSMYAVALRRVCEGHFLAVAGSFDEFCTEFLRRDPADVKQVLEQESKSASKPTSVTPAALVQSGPKRPLTLKEKIAASKLAQQRTLTTNSAS